MRIVSFIDGFTSASEPLVTGGTQEDYLILNNQAALLTLFTIDSADYKSVFFNFELARAETGASFLQVGSGILSFNGTIWELSIGSYQGDDLIHDALTTDESVTLSVITSLGAASLKYTSGNMSTVYTGTIKMFITRIAAA